MKSEISKRRVFILGAGFSASAGIPLVNELLSKSMSNFKLECPGLFERIENYAQESFRLSKIDYSSISFSDLCTYLEYIELREFGGGERFSARGSREKLGLRYFLAKTIAETTPVKTPDLYKNFVKQLRKGDVVLTFNWDCLLESALDESDMRFSYKIDFSCVNIFKLHGSIHWQAGNRSIFANRETPQWKLLEFSKNEMMGKVYESKQLRQYSAWCKYQPLLDVDPLLVLPGYGKANDVRSIAHLWYQPESCFSHTHDVYVIGLEIAKDDFFIRKFLQGVFPDLDCFSGVPGRKLCVINPSKSVKENYSFAFSYKDIEIINEKFSIDHVNMMSNR